MDGKTVGCVPSSSGWFDLLLLCPDLLWMPVHTKAVVAQRGHCCTWHKEWWDVASLQEGVSAKVLPCFSWLLIHLFESLKVFLGGSGVDGLKEEVCRWS